jgi:hypothetical protein
MYSKNDVWILIGKNNHIVVIENTVFPKNYQDILGKNEVSSNYKNCARTLHNSVPFLCPPFQIFQKKPNIP